MIVEYHEEKLQRAVSAVHSLLGAPVNLYDAGYVNIIRPGDWWEEAFCYTMLRTPELCGNCSACYREAFRRADQTGERVFFICHAGLTCAVVPVVLEGSACAYFTIGEVTDEPDRQRFCDDVARRTAELPTDHAELRRRALRVPYVARNLLEAGADLLEIAAHGVLFEQAIRRRETPLAERIDSYIRDHLSGQLTAERLARAFGICRTDLYTLARENYQMGIAARIRELRLKEARRLLGETRMPIAAVAAKLGFSCYDNFYEFFRRSTGRAPGEYRKNPDLPLP